MIGIHMRKDGVDFLRHLLSDYLVGLGENSQSFEVDPNRLQSESPEELAENTAALLGSAQSLFDRLIQPATLELFPRSLRCVAFVIASHGAPLGEKIVVPLLGGIFVLRLIVPAMLTPEWLGISQLPAAARRKVLLVGKLLQTLANGVEFGQKEPYMTPLNSFITSNKSSMAECLLSMCVDPRDSNFTDLLAPSSWSGETAPAGLNHEDVVYFHQLVSMYSQTLIRISEMPKEMSLSGEVYPDFQALVASLGPPPQTQQERDLLKQQRASRAVSGLFSIPQSEAPAASSSSAAGVLSTLPLADEPTEDASEPLNPESEAEYLAYHKEALESDLSDMADANFIYCSSSDNSGRPVVVLVAARLPARGDFRRVFLQIIKTMDSVVIRDYTLVFCCANMSAANRPSITWLKSMHKIIGRKYRKNMKMLFLVHPSAFLKGFVSCFRPFVSQKFWRKLQYIDNLSQFSGFMNLNAVHLPELVYDFDNKNLPPHQHIKSPHAVFGVPLVELFTRSGKMPLIATTTIQHLYDNCTHIEGLFRIAGSQAEVQRFRRIFEDGHAPDFTGCDVHAISGVLKLFLREMPDPLIPLASYDAFLQAIKNQPDDAAKIANLLPLVQLLPPAHQALLFDLCVLLARVAQNKEQTKMSSKNLSIVIAPNILRSGQETQLSMLSDVGFISNVVDIFIRFPRQIFPPPLPELASMTAYWTDLQDADS
eukprot:TRINITY_DN13397_c0_g1_i1.p1 TRINITY_DN13397_c0_g1~~TRINITY_DN13397_c0_g1_i1.p1  ORF type:complete len:792 (-),score=144.29 TRINITY_DN13397_c0_g1_i1:1-2127(-)